MRCGAHSMRSSLLKGMSMPQLRQAVECMPTLIVLDDLHLLCPGEAEGPEAAPGPRAPAVAEWFADALDELRYLQPDGRLPLPGLPFNSASSLPAGCALT